MIEPTDYKSAKFLFFDHDGTLVDTNLFYQSNEPINKILNPETVGVIAKTEIPFAIVAGTYRKHVDRTVKTLPRKPEFTVCLDDTYPKTKPDSEPYLLALKNLEGRGLKASDVIVFEDSDVGETSAKGAGLRVIRIKSYEKIG